MVTKLIGRTIVSFSPSYRLRLEDGRYVFMSWHHYSGPFFYKDRFETREIVHWYEDPLMVKAVNWFIKRGNKA